MPTYVYMDGFADAEEVELPGGYERTDSKRSAQFVLFAEDPTKTLRRLPPRSGFSGMTREKIIDNIRRYGRKSGWEH